MSERQEYLQMNNTLNATHQAVRATLQAYANATEISAEDVQETANAKCIRNALSTLHFLLPNRDNFQRMFLVASFADLEVPYRQNWRHHGHLLLQDQEGLWIGVSPANFDSTKVIEENVADSVVVGESLDEVVSSLVERDGGNLPSAAYLDVNLQGKYIHPYVGLDKPNILHFTLSVYDPVEKRSKIGYVSHAMNEDGTVRF